MRRDSLWPYLRVQPNRPKALAHTHKNDIRCYAGTSPEPLALVLLALGVRPLSGCPLAG
jgi:hypothetical protein